MQHSFQNNQFKLMYQYIGTMHIYRYVWQMYIYQQIAHIYELESNKSEETCNYDVHGNSLELKENYEIFANGAMSAAFRVAFNELAGSTRSPTRRDKIRMSMVVSDSIEETLEQIDNQLTIARNGGRDSDEFDLLQSYNALDNANIEYNLDTYGLNNAEMDFGGHQSTSSSIYPTGTRLRVYRGAFEAYLNGSPAASGYSINLPRGKRGILGMITHESGHGVYRRNFNSQGRLRSNRERLADRWINIIWNGAF